jgi:6-phosphogluconolactonase
MSIIQSYGETRDVVIAGDHEQTIQYCTEHFIAAANYAIADHDFFTVALSGGSTPKEVFSRLASPENRASVNWKKVRLFWSDERTVGPDHPDSNYKMAMDAGFSHIGIPKENIFRMIGESNLEENALAYEKIIREKVPSGSFDYIMLGMGNDGHTASLFPRTHGLHSVDRTVIANFIPKLDTWRLSLTYECINKSKIVVIYVLGKGKSSMLREVLLGPYQPDDLPIQKIGTPQHRALWIVDNEAAKDLNGDL